MLCPSPAQYSSSRPRAAPAIVSSIKRLGSLQQGLEGRYHDISSETAEQARHAAQRAIIQNSVHKIQNWFDDLKHCLELAENIEYYYLDFQANPKKLHKKMMLFLVSMREMGLSHDIF